MALGRRLATAFHRCGGAHNADGVFKPKICDDSLGCPSGMLFERAIDMSLRLVGAHISHTMAKPESECDVADGSPTPAATHR